MSKSSVSRQFIEASEEECRKLLERRSDDVDILVIYIDGMVFADHAVIGAVGVDRMGMERIYEASDAGPDTILPAESAFYWKRSLASTP